MGTDRITQLRISGLRTIEQVVLHLQGLTVLIGENGVGKSSIIEALELLRMAASPGMFVPDVLEQRHGGLRVLLRHGASELCLGVTIEGDGPRLEYDFAVGRHGTVARVLRERLDVHANPAASEPLHAIERVGDHTRVFDLVQRQLVSSDNAKLPIGTGAVEVAPGSLALPFLGVVAQPAVQRALAALGGIDVHVALDTRPVWQAFDLKRALGPRWPSPVKESERLARYGDNLALVFQRLQNSDERVWERVRDRARLGFGPSFRGFKLRPTDSGQLELQCVFAGAPDQPIPVTALSEGQVGYLCILALVELRAGRTCLAFDEPEGHFHPALLDRVVEYLEDAAVDAPVLLATHSDGLLDALEAPAESVVVCDLDERQATRLRRLDQGRLDRWLADYRGVGAIRAEGLEAHVLRDPPADTSARR